VPTAIVCLAAKGVVRDADSGNISVFAILERLAPEGFPVLLQEVGLLIIWRRLQGEPQVFDAVVQIHNNSRQLLQSPLRADFGPTALHRSIVSLQGLVIYEPGNLRFSVSIGTDEVAHYEVEVTPRPAQARTP
jgi:hypothetical protein